MFYTEFSALDSHRYSSVALTNHDTKVTRLVSLHILLSLYIAKQNVIN